MRMMSLICNRGQRGYRFKQAEAKAQARHAIRSRPRKLTAPLRRKIEAKLRQMRWSPEQISGWLFEQGIKLSHERIYQMIWQDKRDGGDLWRSLRRRGKRYNKRGGKPACRAIGLHRPPVGTFVPGIVSRDGSVVGGRANCDGGGRRLVGSIVGSTGVKNASPWADLPPKAMSPFAVETRSPGRNVGSFFTPSGARPKGSLPLQVQFATSSLR